MTSILFGIVEMRFWKAPFLPMSDWKSILSSLSGLPAECSACTLALVGVEEFFSEFSLNEFRYNEAKL